MKELLCPVCREQMTFSAIGDLARCKYCDAVVSTTEPEEYYSNINTISFSIKEKNLDRKSVV